MAKNGYTLFVELLAMERRERELAALPADHFGDTEPAPSLRSGDEADTEPYVWDTRQFLLAPTDPE
jgi:hypothetical protein